MTESSSKSGSRKGREKVTQQRSCVVCRKKADKGTLLRLVCNKEGRVFTDKDFKLPGRGAYLHSNLACIMKADNSRIWQHVFKNKLVDKEQVRQLLEEVRKFLVK